MVLIILLHIAVKTTTNYCNDDLMLVVVGLCMLLPCGCIKGTHCFALRYFYS